MIKKVGIILMILIIFISIDNIKQKEQAVISVVETKEDQTYQKIYITFNNLDINTKNLEEKLSDLNIKILTIYPYINPIYKEKIQKISYPYSIGLKRIEQYTIETIEKQGYTITNTGGIPIETISFYGTMSDLKALGNKYPNAQYSFIKEGVKKRIEKT